MTDESGKGSANRHERHKAEVSHHARAPTTGRDSFWREGPGLELKLRGELVNATVALNTMSEQTEDMEERVTELRRVNARLLADSIGLREKLDEVESVNRRQVEFLSTLAHELRKPLAPMINAAALLGKITDAHQDLPRIQGIIARQIGLFTRLIEDLLDTSRAALGKITLQKRVLSIAEVIESAVEVGQPRIDEHQQSLVVKLPTHRVLIEGDLVRLTQIFCNLLLKASKFTPDRGNIAVSAHALSDSVAVSVKDDGEGIASEVQPFIFNLFSQGPSATKHSIAGLGVGLSLVRSIAELHGGDVQVRSDGVGTGSEFIVRLPILKRTTDSL